MTDSRSAPLRSFTARTSRRAAKERQALEKHYGEQIRLFPLPCSGRLDPVHLLRALEEFADAAYLITCPEGACRYFEGNRRAEKRWNGQGRSSQCIGLEGSGSGSSSGQAKTPRRLAQLATEIIDRMYLHGPSPALKGPPWVKWCPHLEQGETL